MNQEWLSFYEIYETEGINELKVCEPFWNINRREIKGIEEGPQVDELTYKE